MEKYNEFLSGSWEMDKNALKFANTQVQVLWCIASKARIMSAVLNFFPSTNFLASCGIREFWPLDSMPINLILLFDKLQEPRSLVKIEDLHITIFANVRCDTRNKTKIVDLA